MVFLQREAALPVRSFSLGFQCGHDNLVAFFKGFFFRFSSYFDLDLLFIGTMKLTTWNLLQRLCKCYEATQKQRRNNHSASAHDLSWRLFAWL